MLPDWLQIILSAAFLFCLFIFFPDTDDALWRPPRHTRPLPSLPVSELTPLDLYLGPTWARYECVPLRLIDSS